ncbi:cytochrome-c oxidase, cbb3-type subunit I [Roseivirga thermotolerans]|uniref:cytochrome-c oxidase n=1 Tax=Roseivirga thermotolerans TaxID=1758176 RepID=A0ABQ3I309_9BACT|nr:cytochrome-c oxidase, cbb3-type subunit I [Roseivirga thermotolerans]GHE59875.1 bifunctional cbb3-type cytochrome C oxidase subunit I/II [Roseivirga thermotolerans]
MELEQFRYDNKIVKYFAIATVIFGIIGMLVGLLIATQLFLPQLNFGIQYTTFGRIRPLHTNAVIFAFVGNAMFAGVYYSMQRLLKARMFSDLLSWIHFWGWQLIILAAAITLPLGYTTSKEYAELEWPIDIAITLIWVVFGINMIGTILKRRERHMYVAIWFYIATFVTVAVLHVVNSFEIPVTFLKSYSWYAGVQDALVQWWYGHNAVAFFLTTPFLGLMYYYLPKAANRPVYSYKLSIIHFWSLIFIYIWAGPHHLLYTSLPDWAQSLGTVFSVMLIAPSWGGMLNGLLTLRGAWDRVREDPVLKFMVVAVTAYGMATLEGPLLSIKNINAIAHFTDWIIAHVHVGGLGWNGFIIFGILYWLVPKMWGTKLWSTKAANVHFWLGTLGIIVYALPLYTAGVVQSLMWKNFNAEGFLEYPNFLETVTQIVPMYMMRAIGGLLYFTGVIIMAVNLVKTARQGSFIANEAAEAPALQKKKKVVGGYWHNRLERKPVFFTVLVLVAILIGGVVEMVPTFLIKSNIPTIASVQPYTPLELHGRDIYIREGCNNCHSQMVRPFRSETVRYKGEYSKAGEFVYDHPFLWGSKRTGPDLHRVGGAYNNTWHFNHMVDPTSTSPGSIMPPYPWLYTQSIDPELTAGKIKALRTVGVPYEEGYEKVANAELKEQATQILKDLEEDPSGSLRSYEALNEVKISESSEIIALIAYLQRLGTDIKAESTENK